MCVCVSGWGVRLMGGLSVVDDLTITGNFPTVCTQRGPSKGKKDEKEKKFNTVCKKGGRSGYSMRKRLL